MGKTSQDLTNGVVTYLATIGYGTAGVDLFSPTMPQSPNIATVIVPTGGIVDVTDPTRRASFQILHRNTNINSGFWFTAQLYTAIHNQWDKIPGFNGRFVAKHESGPNFRDENNHAVFPLNFIFFSTIL